MAGEAQDAIGRHGACVAMALTDAEFIDPICPDCGARCVYMLVEVEDQRGSFSRLTQCMVRICVRCAWEEEHPSEESAA
jgi:hypothetical protein